MAEKENWQARADELHEKGGVPPRRAEAVALRERGETYEAIADRLGLSGRGSAYEHVSKYRDRRERVQWLSDHGPTGGAL